MDYRNKNILVVGAARSGISAAKLLIRLGAHVTLADSKAGAGLPESLSSLSLEGIELCLGQNAGEEMVSKQSLVIASPGIPLEMETFEFARALSIPIMGEMEFAFTLCPCPVAAITGTNGKTTTAVLAGEIIKRHIPGTVTVGNIGRPFTECVSELDADGFAVVEASSFQLENMSVFKPKISAVLNVTPDHLDRHKTFEKYLEAKTNVFKYTDDGCFVILNRDDPLLKNLPVNTGAKVLFFSTKEKLTQKTEGAYLQNGEIVLRYNGGEEKLTDVKNLRIPGKHNVSNALAASLVAVCAGVPVQTIERALAEFEGVPHRLEFVMERNGVKYYNDSKGTNPDAAVMALDAMEGKTVLIAGGYDKNACFGVLVPLFNERLSHLVLLGETGGIIAKECDSAGFKRYTVATGFAEAVELAAGIASPGENVLLSPACASWDMFRDFEERGEFFKKLVNNL